MSPAVLRSFVRLQAVKETVIDFPRVARQSSAHAVEVCHLHLLTTDDI